MSGKPNEAVFRTMVEKHGSEEAARAWYRSIGQRGGSVSNPNKGFASMDKEKIREAGRKGGSISKRKPAWY